MRFLRRLLIVVVLLVLVGVTALFIAGRRSSAGRMAASIDLARPPVEVLPWLLEPDRQVEWMSGLVEASSLTDGPVRVGSRWRQVFDDGRERIEMESAVTQLAGDSVVGVRVSGDNFRVDGRYALLPIASGTRLRYASTAHFSHPLLALIEPLITPSAQKKLDGDFIRLKMLADGGLVAPRALTITTTDGAVDLSLAGDSITGALSAKTLAAAGRKLDTSGVKRDGVGGSIERMVKSRVQRLLTTRVSYPLDDISDARYEDGAIRFEYHDGRDHQMFEGFKMNGRALLESFSPDDARRFVDAVRAAKRRG